MICLSPSVKRWIFLLVFYLFSRCFSTFWTYLKKKIIFPLEKLKMIKIFPQFRSSDPHDPATRNMKYLISEKKERWILTSSAPPPHRQKMDKSVFFFFFDDPFPYCQCLFYNFRFDENEKCFISIFYSPCRNIIFQYKGMYRFCIVLSVFKRWTWPYHSVTTRGTK